MPLRDPIPQAIEFAQNRRAKYRLRAAWGGNHLQKKDVEGNLMASALARSAAVGHPLSVAVDGYRPAVDPLDAAYEGYWESVGRPLLPLQHASILTSGYSDCYLGDNFTDTDSVQLADHTAAPYNNTHHAWIDPSDRFQILSNALQKDGAPDMTSYIDMDCDEYFLHFTLNVDSDATFSGGALVRYVDATHHVYVRLHSDNAGQVDIVDADGTVYSTDTAWTIAVGAFDVLILVTRRRIAVWVDGVNYGDVANVRCAFATKIGPHCVGCDPSWNHFYAYRPLRFWEEFADWSNFTLTAWGANTGEASGSSGSFGTLTVESSSAGSVAGYTGLLSFERITRTRVWRDSVYQAQIGINRLTHVNPRYSRAGICISNSNSEDISAETDAVLIFVDQSSAGCYLKAYKIVASAATLVGNQLLATDEYSDGIRAIISAGTLKIYSAKLGLITSTALANLDAIVYLKTYVETDDEQAVIGYFRDLAVFPSNSIRLQGEIGLYDDFSEWAADGYWPSDDTTLSQITDGTSDAMFVEPDATTDPAYAGIFMEGGDFVWEGEIRKLNDDDEETNLIFRCSDLNGASSGCYVVRFADATGVTLGKDLAADRTGPVSDIAQNADVHTVSDELFTFKIEAEGDRFKVWKNDVLVIDATDADYSYGCFAFSGLNAVDHDGDGDLEIMNVLWHKISPRGFQQPIRLRIDRPMIQNPSFEDWDDLDGLTEDPGEIPAAWKMEFSMGGVTSGSISRDSVDPYLGDYAVKLSFVTPQSDAYFSHQLYQKSVKFVQGHTYRVSFATRFDNDGGGLVGGDPVLTAIARRWSFGDPSIAEYDVPIATATANLLADGEWIEYSFTFDCDLSGSDPDRSWLVFKIACSNPAGATSKPTGDFSIALDRVMIEDITGLADADVPILAWTETPVTYREQYADHAAGDDFSKPTYQMPYNIAWRENDNFTWGLLDFDGADLFTSRAYTFAFPGSEWKLRPEWLAFDFGAELDTNQLVYYPLWSSGLRWLLCASGDYMNVRHVITQVMRGLATYSTAFKLDFELEDEVTARHFQVIIVDTDDDGETATAQEVELYQFEDESLRIIQPPDAGPSVSLSVSRASEAANSLPNAAALSVSLANSDGRFTPRNKFSPIFGTRQSDGLGWIRSGVPVRLSMVMEDAEIEYETPMFSGVIGADQNVGGALGISLAAASKVATLDAVDFTAGLDQPTPVDQIDPEANVDAEDAIATLCLLANIPEQDQDFDATGQTLPLLIFPDQSLRAVVEQIVRAVGGRFHADPSGRVIYRNAATGRSWTQTDKADFDLGAKTNMDTASVPGELTCGNVQWGINHQCDVFPESEDVDPWTTDNADDWRYVNDDGRYVVMCPASQNSAMISVLKKDYNDADGFMIEFDVELPQFPNNQSPFTLWGYTTDVVDHGTDEDYYSAACAWRISLSAASALSVRLRAGGKKSSYGYSEPYYDGNVVVGTYFRYRVRLCVSAGNTAIYLNDAIITTVPLTYPGYIRWSGTESNSEYQDAFGSSAGNLNGRAGDVNTTRDTWHDTSNRWRVNVGGYLDRNPASQDDGTTYLDFGPPEAEHEFKLYLDRTTADSGGIRVKRLSAAEHLIVRFVAQPSGSNPNMIWARPEIARVQGGVENIVAEFPSQHVYEGSQTIRIVVSLSALAVYFTGYNPVDPPGEILLGSFVIPQALWGASAFAPYAGTDSAISIDDWHVVRTYNWLPPAADEYEAKCCIGPDACVLAYLDDPETYAPWVGLAGYHKPGWVLDYVRQKLFGTAAPATAGEFISSWHDATASLVNWGIFEAEVIDAPPAPGPYGNYASLQFYVQVSADAVTWDAWVLVTPGEVMPAAVAVKKYVRWKIVFSKIWGRTWWRHKIREVTINWNLNTSEDPTALRVTWDVSAPSDAVSIESNEGSGSLGNPTANRVTAQVSRWVEQALTDSAVTPFWQSQELPAALLINEEYVLRADYPFPSAKKSGADLRHAHVSIDSTVYDVDDGTVDQVCGNALITFSSGQKVGVVTIEATAALTIDSVQIDAVAYFPASELDGVEKVQAEDTDAQNLYGRVVEKALEENSFTCSRQTAQTYADAELEASKRHREAISGINIPVLPSLSLNKLLAINNPALGLHERQCRIAGLTHSGFTTSLELEAVRIAEAEDDFDPLDLSPTGAYAPMRLPSCASSYIFKMRNALGDAEVDVYDVQQDTTYYKISAGGAWIDSSEGDWHLDSLYDQTGNGRTIQMSTPASQPAVIFNSRNGWPRFDYDGVDDYLAGSVASSDHVGAAAGTIAVEMKATGTASASASLGSLEACVRTGNAKLGIAVGDLSSGGDKLHVWNNDGNDDDVTDDFARDSWLVVCWRHGSGNLDAFVEGVNVGTAASGNTADLTQALTLGNTPFAGLLGHLYTFSSALTDGEISQMSGWIAQN